IGLKVQAMINDPQRQKQEMLDIESLLTLENYSVNWKKLEEYFQLFELTDDFNMLKKRYQNA
ncbi:MAG: hypothetical protein KC733_07320, partial [Candidatus Omnitrophica bacterium]|nr:hypothetical protein [Candidatus Omnitrophota bacterium]